MTHNGGRRGRAAVMAAIALVAGMVVTVATPGTAHAVAPGNDSFATPTTLAGGFGVVRGTTVGASKEAGEPDHAGVLGNKSVWFRWTAPSTGRVVFRMDLPVELDFDTLLAVYQGDAVDALSVVASNDDVLPGEWASRVAFAAQAGATYMVAVDGVAGKSGTFVLSWGMRPANDDFAAAQRVVGPVGSTRSDTTLATRQVGEAAWQRRSVWYRWTAPRTGSVAFRTDGSLFDTVLGVYTGPSLASIRLLARNDDFGFGLTSRVLLPVRQGRTYRVVVAGFAGDGGPLVLRWRMP